MTTQRTPEEEFRRMVRRKTILSFSFFIFFILAGFFVYRFLVHQPEENGALRPLRKAMEWNSRIFSRSFASQAPAQEYPKTRAVSDVRVNGDVGMDTSFSPENWELRVVRFSEHAPQPGDTIEITLDEIRALPKTEVVFNFKCIEGWSQITWWGGVKFSDFVKHYKIGTRDGSVADPSGNPGALAKYAGMMTPDGEYYVGIDMPSMMHPQTILCYEMNGKPLPYIQGAPLRLIIPVKYGVKHLKRIGTLYFSDTPPPDYWFEQGYDYFAGL